MSSKALAIAPLYARILSKFPQQISFSFAYGSAVKKQLKNSSKENMVDLIFCVDNAAKWHEANMRKNPSHYSGLKYLGHNFIGQYQQNFGAKIYFNTLVPIEGVTIKYGVISKNDLITDLLEWSDLYVAGRLHKPVEILRDTSNSELLTALQLNLQSAVHAALLILPEAFSEYEFFYTVSNLSYSGDFRMTFGENKNKVENIVRPQLLSFRQLYKPHLDLMSDFVEFPSIKDTEEVIEKEQFCSQDISPLAKLHHLNQLPRWPQKALTRVWNKGTLRQDTEDVLRAVAYYPDCNDIVKQCLSEIVWKSSVSQSLKGILTAGLLKSIQYSSKKVAKMFV